MLGLIAIVASYLGISMQTLLLGLLIGYLTYFWITPILFTARRAPSRPKWKGGDYKRECVRGSGKDIPCRNPATGEELPGAKAYTPEEVKNARLRASQAAKDWSQTDFTERKALMMDILDWILDNQELIARKSCEETGKTMAEASLGEVMTTLEKLRWLVAKGEQCLQPENRDVPLLLAFTKSARVEWYPMGVIGIIVPWNYPFHNVLSHVATALFAGNGAVVKVSEWASSSAKWIEDVLREIIGKRGYNPDLVQIITGYGETGAALVQSGVEKVLFIGSPGVGKLVMKGASSTLTPVILELGGKDAFVVCDDADLDHAIDIAIRGAFINCGQNCISAERFLVQDGIYDEFLKKILIKLKKTRQGASCKGLRCDFGAMTMPSQAKHVEKLIADATSKGARVLYGGKRKGTEGKHPTYFEPTVLADVDLKMEIATEETFGPVMTVIRWKSEDELEKLCNSTPYGLGSSIFSKDYSKAERISKRIVTGMANINDFAIVPLIQSLPFGGVRASGFGAFNGKEGLRGFSYRKAITTDRLGIRAAAPDWLQYPVSSSAKNIVQQAMFMVYGRSVGEAVMGCINMVRLVLKAPSKKDDQAAAGKATSQEDTKA